MAERIKNLLIVSHAPSENTKKLALTLFQAAKETIKESEIAVNVQQKEALIADSDDVLAADAIILMTTENLGYMSGGMKDFFDRNYYPCLEKKQGLPMCLIIRAGHDGAGTKRAIESITTGLKWRWVQEPLILQGDWQVDFLRQVEELSQAMAIALHEGII
jgi:multimeric flavodoxin WrbA